MMIGTGQPLAEDDPRRVPLLSGISEVHQRYGQSLMISDTSHLGERRAQWLREVAKDGQLAMRAGIPLEGLCHYPLLGMPEWHDQQSWTQMEMGLWQCQLRHGVLQPDLHEPMHAALCDVRPWARTIAS
jgi:hypothetical protein